MNTMKTLSLVKGKDHFCFRYESGQEAKVLAQSIKDVLGEAIKIGGTTLRDYVNADGAPGYFRQKLFVYERVGEACRVCKSPVKQFVQGQRSTYWCSTCQR